MDKKCKYCLSQIKKGEKQTKQAFQKKIFCDRKCYWLSLCGRKIGKLSDEHKRKIGLGNLGKIHTLEQNKKHSEYLKGKKPWNKGKKGIYSHDVLKKISIATKKAMGSVEVKEKLSIAKRGKPGPWLGRKRPDMTGERHFAWKGGVSSENEKARKSLEYKLWRKSVFERDSYTCQVCKASGVTLNADHIKPFAYFPELRFAIDNGVTLCVPCHKATPTFANGAKKLYSHIL